MVAVIILCVLIAAGYRIYERIYAANILISDDPQFLMIPTSASFDKVCTLLLEAGLQNEASFRWTAHRMNYPDRVKAGRYRLPNGMNNIELVRMLRSGRQIPVKVTFNNIRTGAQLAGKVAVVIETDSAGIAALFSDDVFLNKHHLTPETAISVFIPNTYEFQWNTSAKQFWERMLKEHTRFWNEERRRKADAIEMTPLQVSILASIIEEETQMNDEKPMMASVYINRLQRAMPLQADPTLKFAAGDFSIRRILDKHKEIQSPYNTYLHTGLPPGPICMPSVASLDAVLNYKKSDYLYFCAKEDLTGYHNFSKTLAQHNRNAEAYQKALNKLRIYN
ncbi:MAG: endolytic transglycosylase MltG [Bacteroidales bacterium]|jgi:UPF0755 protein|nr:endolytic transglycosylase MltG [Bacteroidales bacterium]